MQEKEAGIMDAHFFLFKQSLHNADFRQCDQQDTLHFLATLLNMITPEARTPLLFREYKIMTCENCGIVTETAI